VSCAVIVPTYNERENIVPLVEALIGLTPVHAVVVVDDSSPDGTGDLADILAQRHPAVRVIHRPGKLGLGTAYVAGFKLALDLPVAQILTMDADLSHDPARIPDLVEAAAAFDVVIGSRYVPGGSTRNWGLRRQFLSGCANMTARLALGFRAKDCTAGFRCYRRRVLEAIDLAGIKSDGYSYLVEILYRCQRAGFSIGERPIVFDNRRRGTSKISQREIYKAMLTVARLAHERLLGS
jgi:dolichol-phosphate mannosyltransferase